MSWPKLSEDLKQPRTLTNCLGCTDECSPDRLHRWMEHDEADRPTGVVVVLCPICSGRIIGPHKRLYRLMAKHEPCAGAMLLCTDCKYQKDLGCLHPRSLKNGGVGIALIYPQPATGFWDGRDPKTGKRTGGQFTRYLGPVTECDGKELNT